MSCCSIRHVRKLTRSAPIPYARSKTERKMTLEQFEVALGFLAEKKYPGQPDGVEKLKARIATGSGPLTHGVTVSLLCL